MPDPILSIPPALATAVASWGGRPAILFPDGSGTLAEVAAADQLAAAPTAAGIDNR